MEKKGFPDLLQALGRLKASGRRIKCQVYGDGPLAGALTELRDSLGLTDDVHFAGERSREAIIRLSTAQTSSCSLRPSPRTVTGTVSPTSLWRLWPVDYRWSARRPVAFPSWSPMV